MIKLFKRILEFSGKYKGRIQLATAMAFIETMLSRLPIYLSFIVLTAFYYDKITPQMCLTVGLVLVGMIVLQIIVRYASDALQSGAGFMVLAEKRMELGSHLRKLPMGYYTEGNIGKISSVLTGDMVFIEETAMSTLANMMNYFFSSIVLVVFMSFLDIRLGGVAIVVTVLAAMIASKMNKVSSTEAIFRQEQGENLTEAVISYAEGIGVIKSYNLSGEKSKELTDNFTKSRNVSLSFENKMTPWTLGLNLMYALGVAIIFTLAIVFGENGELPIAYLLGVLLFVFELFTPLKALYGEATRLTIMNAALDRIESVLDENTLSDVGTSKIPSESNETEISFQNVSFAYDNEKDVLKNISFDVQKNTMTALVGQSGGGKSTTANLLARLWDINTGKILIRGVDVRDIPLSHLMEHISMVFQNVYLFQDTIWNNIAMGKPDALEHEVIEAAEKARCYDFIMSLPEGFQTVIGEGGNTLSGGEKQRISIARCILKDAPIVILDEATASVDVDNETYIQEAISELVKGKTLLVIAHRLNTIKEAQQILVINNGEVVERGTHSELINLDGVYKLFVDKINKS